tara:strand:- start:207 stop:983 length:777 start_codon:yes stop_codon:yes gene_type:complete
MNKKSTFIVQNAPGGCFTIIEEKDELYILLGCHNSAKEKNEISIPDLVWPKEKRTITDWKVNRKDRKNGMYLLKSTDGTNWEEILNKPVLHAYISSDSCKLGECCFDTHPSLIKHDNEYYYYGRLNSSLDERRVYLRKSKDLLEWSLPEKIIITNENNNRLKKNYYNFVVFKDSSIFYAFTPYFEACGTPKRKTTEGKTLLLKSEDGLSWEIIKDFFHHSGRYKDRVNSYLLEDNKKIVFLRENCTSLNQKLVSYELI